MKSKAKEENTTEIKCMNQNHHWKRIREALNPRTCGIAEVESKI